MYFNFSNLLEENRIVTYQNQQPYYDLFIIVTQKIVITATKWSSWLFSIDVGTGIYKFRNNTLCAQVTGQI